MHKYINRTDIGIQKKCMQDKKEIFQTLMPYLEYNPIWRGQGGDI